MLETTITALALLCAASVSTMSLVRWRRSEGYRAAVFLGFAVCCGLVAILNLTILLAAGESFLWTAALAYAGFATAAVLPAALALGQLTYEEPSESDSEDAAV